VTYTREELESRYPFYNSFSEGDGYTFIDFKQIIDVFNAAMAKMSKK
jgi:hypothetical protein